jgi:hypothetical protein
LRWAAGFPRRRETRLSGMMDSSCIHEHAGEIAIFRSLENHIICNFNDFIWK